MHDNQILIRNNALSGVFKVIIRIILPFCVRTVMIYALGKEYLGLDGLFTSILSVLNLAEIGFSNAVVYCMYEPIANNDFKRVNTLLNLYKRIYIVIGTVVFSCGILITPFISYLIKGSWPENINLYLLFSIYLVNSSISYFFYAYKTALLNALKRIDIVNNIHSLMYLAQYSFQIVVLFLFKNYYAYIIITPICTLTINLLIAGITNKKYPQFKCEGIISHEDRNKIIKSVKSIILYRISEVTRNSLDTIIISSFFGLAQVAIYNNYYYIFQAVYSVIIVLNQSIQAIIGQNLVLKSREENFKDLQQFNFVIMWIVSWCSITMICLFQPFMKIWVGESMCYPFINAILFGIYFYVLNMNDIRNLYYDGKGLWPEGKWTFIFEIVGNLLLNILLGKLLGPTGIIIATIVTIFIFSFIFRSKILFKAYFNFSAKAFFEFHLRHGIITVFIMIIAAVACNCFHFESMWFQIVSNFIICLTVINFGFFIIYRNDERLQFIKSLSSVSRKR